MKIEGTFVSEALGRTQKPAGWVGQGAVTTDETGLILEGMARSNGLISLLAFLGFALGIAGSVALGFEARATAIAGVGLLFAGAAAGANLTKAKELRVHIAWNSIKKPRLVETSFVFISHVAPKGQVTFVLGTPSEAVDLQNALGHEGIEVKV